MVKEKRSMWNKIFGEKDNAPNNATQLQWMNGFTPSFTSFGEDPYASDVVRSAIHAIATNAAKLNPKHIRKTGKDMKQVGGDIEKLLSLRPNRFMSAFDFYYKTITQLYLKNNAFIFINYDGFTIEGFYPVDASSVELLEANDEIYVRFQFANGKKLTAPYEQFIHLRRFFAKSDMFGESNDAMMTTLKLIHTTDEGIGNAVKSSAFLRGLLKYTAMLKDEDLKKNRDRFTKDYMDVSNSGGIAALDSKAEYQELKNDPKMIDSKQMDAIAQKVYTYFGISKSIVTSDYTEDQWNAFYESVLEPIAIQMSQEFTSKLFTEREQGHGNEIIFEANRLAYASNKTKIALLKELAPLGLFTINEGREIFNMAPVEGGEKRIQTLNVVDADKANKYQGVDDDNPPEGGETIDDEEEADETDD